jgi:hypothetical protein
MVRETQRNCEGFKGILRQPLRGSSESGQSDRLGSPISDYATGGVLFTPEVACGTSYHCGSVIAVSASGGRQTDCIPVRKSSLSGLTPKMMREDNELPVIAKWKTHSFAIRGCSFPFLLKTFLSLKLPVKGGFGGFFSYFSFPFTVTLSVSAYDIHSTV